MIFCCKSRIINIQDRIGNTLRKQGYFNEELYFNYDVVEFKKGYNDAEIVCYSHADNHIGTSQNDLSETDSIMADTMATSFGYAEEAAVDFIEEEPAY